jgi:hypothetical protein
MNQVVRAPKGAARLKIIKWPRAALFDNPCLRRTDVRPKAAGALCTIMATNIIKPSDMFEVDADAPIAMPSAAACITRPVVVAKLRVCFGLGVKDWRKLSDSSPFSSVGDS